MTGGRKREFDENIALYAAMEVFWEKGYVGASLSELTEKMGINKPSMYSVFGNKEELFIKATRLYIGALASPHMAYLHESDVNLRQRIKNYLMSMVAMQCDPATPNGCFIALCEAEATAGDMPKEAAQLLMEAGGSMPVMLTEFFTQDAEAISTGLNLDAEAKALCLVNTIRGTASLARAGKSVSELDYVIDHSLKGIGL